MTTYATLAFELLKKKISQILHIVRMHLALAALIRSPADRGARIRGPGRRTGVQPICGSWAFPAQPI